MVGVTLKSTRLTCIAHVVYYVYYARLVRLFSQLPMVVTLDTYLVNFCSYCYDDA